MAKQEQTAITPTREQDYSEWYQQVVKASDLCRPIAGTRLHGDQALGLWPVGTDRGASGPID